MKHAREPRLANVGSFLRKTRNAFRLFVGFDYSLSIWPSVPAEPRRFACEPRLTWFFVPRA